jgi:hypothetical protein
MGARLESRSHKDRESAGRAKAAYQRRFTPEGAHQVRRSDRGIQRDTEMGLPRKLVRAAAMFFLWSGFPAANQPSQPRLLWRSRLIEAESLSHT